MRAFIPLRFVIVPIVALSASLALPAASAWALDDAAVKCRATIAKNVSKYTAKVAKAIAGCHKGRAKGKVPAATDCNDLSQADPNGKLASAASKAKSKFDSGSKSKCVDGAGSDLATVLTAYARCPSPLKTVDDGGATTGIDSFDELADCLIGLVDPTVAAGFREAMGNPPDSPLPEDAAACHNAIGKRLGKLIDTIIDVRSACQAEADADAVTPGYDCATADPEGEIADAQADLEQTIADNCEVDDDSGDSTKVETDRMQLCGDTVEQLQECVSQVVGTRLGGGLTGMSYSLPDECRAGGVTRTLRAAGGEQITRSRLDTGWSGTAQGVDVPDAPRDTMRTACDPDCSNCAASNEPAKNRPHSYCRCANDPQVSCEDTGVADPDNCGVIGDNTCYCYFGPPLPLSSGAVPVCVLNRMRADRAGIVDVGDPDNDAVTIFNNGVVHLGDDVLHPCPRCLGDPTPLDGVPEGICDGGVSNGASCDVQSIDHTFGPVSHDCQPDSALNVSGSGLVIDLDYTTTSQSLPFTLPCDSTGLCPCRVCSGNSLVGCASDAECAAQGAGTCTAGGGAGVEPNACTDGVCTEEERCATGPDDRYCDGIRRSNGNGFLACNTNAECAAFSGGGSCTIVERRRCYPDPLEVDARGGFYSVEVSSIFCIPPTTSPAVNNSGGLPGAGRSTLVADSDWTCKGAPALYFEPPAGSNCPETTTTTSTTMPPVFCGDSFPVCDGECPVGTSCGLGLGVCQCN